MDGYWNCEYTDTFAGEANYSWVRRARVPAKDDETQVRVMRRAKRALGLSGVRGRTVEIGDGFEFRPYGSCTIAFVTWDDRETQ